MRMCPADEVFRNGPIFEIWIGPGLNLPGLGWIGPKAQENFMNKNNQIKYSIIFRFIHPTCNIITLAANCFIIITK